MECAGDIDRHHPFKIRQAGVFKRCKVMNAGRYEQQVDTPIPRRDLRNAGLHLSVVANIAAVKCCVSGFVNIKDMRLTSSGDQLSHYGVTHARGSSDNDRNLARESACLLHSAMVLC
jgi:hypothetical protein